jgi:hypothetical protein
MINAAAAKPINGGGYHKNMIAAAECKWRRTP